MLGCRIFRDQFSFRAMHKVCVTQACVGASTLPEADPRLQLQRMPRCVARRPSIGWAAGRGGGGDEDWGSGFSGYVFSDWIALVCFACFNKCIPIFMFLFVVYFFIFCLAIYLFCLIAYWFVCLCVIVTCLSPHCHQWRLPLPPSRGHGWTRAVPALRWLN